MTVSELFLLEKKLLIIESEHKNEINLSSYILLEEILNRIGKITNLFLIEMNGNNAETILRKNINDEIINYYIGDYKSIKEYKEIENFLL